MADRAVQVTGRPLYAATQNTIVPVNAVASTPGTPIPVRYRLPNGIVIKP